MSGRPISKKANIPALKKLVHISNLVDYQPVIVYIMRHSGCTFTEISEVLGLSRQQALTHFKNAEQKASEIYEV